MVVNTNISTLTGLNASRLNGLDLRRSLERLSSGLRINKAADDPSGLAISKGMTAQERGILVAQHNGQDGINLIRTMDGALGQIQNMLNRMRDISVRASNEAPMTADDRTRLNNEIGELKEEITRTAETTTYNTKQVLVGNPGAAAGTWNDQSIPGASQYVYPSVSADGSKMTYYYWNGFTGDLYTENTDGSGQTHLFNILPGWGGGCGPDISGDGSKVVFTDTNGGNLFSINSDGTGLTQLTTAPSSLLSSVTNGRPITQDGSKVVYTELVGGNVDVYIQNTDGTGETRLTTDPAGDGEAVISSDGSKVAFVSFRNGLEDIYSVNPDGTGETQLTFNAGIDSIPTITGDGSKVVFDSDMTGTDEIYIINSDGSGLQQLTFGGGGVPIISDDGSKIVYVDSADNLRVMNSDGSNNTIISNNAHSNFSISSDGNEIVYNNLADGTTHLATFQSTPSTQVLQIGPDNGAQHRIEVEFPDARASAIGVGSVNVSSVAGAQSAIDSIDSAISTVSDYRSNLGVIERRIGNIINDLAAEHTNVSASRSTIEDADFAVEISDFTRSQITQQTTTAMVAQANSMPESVLALLR